MKIIKNLIIAILKKIGFKIVKIDYEFATGKIEKNKLIDELKWIQKKNIKTIIDIGANQGQFSEKMRILFPESKIISFEPLKEAYQILKKNFINDKNYEVYNIALGNNKGVVEIEKNEYSPSSSLLEMNLAHKNNFDFAINTEKVEINIDLLDNIIKPSDIERPSLMKIDVQGYEDQVINGSTNTLKNIDIIICEMSYLELYKNQILFDKLYETFISLGFSYHGNLEQLHSPIDNEILQGDAIFIKI